MDKLLTIIVTAYNKEKFIDECITSLFDGYSSDVLNKIEVLVVDDCSTDNTLLRLQEYAKKYDIKILHQQINKGLPDARNRGLREACGKYTWFVDMDDYILPNALNEVIAELVAYPETDLLQIQIVRFRDGQKDFKREKCCGCITSSPNGQKTFVEYVGKKKYSAYAQQRIVSKDMVIKHNIFEKSGLIWDDAEWSPRAFAFAKHVRYFPRDVYALRRLPDSMSNSKKRNRKHYFDEIVIISSLNEFMDNPENNITAEFRDAVNRFLVSTLLTALSGVLLEDGTIDEELLAEIRKYKYLLKYGSFKRKYIYPFLIKVLGLKLFCKLRG